MTFEEWWDKDDATYVEDLARAAWEAAWDHQQKIIDGFKQANNDLAKAAIRPDGYVLVPVEPTEAMLNAGLDANVVPHPEDIYKAMISAAQEEE